MTNESDAWRARAEARLLQARGRHSARLGGKKSRNGCTTCRSRRVKCDEVRPVCTRCRQGGRECGYEGRGSPDDRDLSGPSQPLSVSKLLGVQETDTRTFDFFISHTAPRLAGALDKNFWCSSVLQLAQQEPFVVDSLLAISVLYEHPQYLASFTGQPGQSPSRDHPGTSFQGPKALDDHHTHALKLYGRAIQRLSARIQKGDTTHSTALLSCVLFICIETIRDNILAAMSLFVQGTNLLKHLDRSKLTTDENAMIVLIERIFQRLAVQAIFYGYPIEALGLNMDLAPHYNFNSLNEARAALFSLSIHCYSFMREADAARQAIIDARVGHASQPTKAANDHLKGYEIFGITRDVKHFYCGSNEPDEQYENHMAESGAFDAMRAFFARLDSGAYRNSLPGLQDLMLQKHELVAMLDRWNAAFQLLLKRTSSDEHLPEAVSYLRMYHVASLIWVKTRLETSEMVYDDCTATFRELLQQASGYVQAIAAQKSAFTFEIGAVLPLFLMASKCRVPSLRRQALDLTLQCPRKESTFGAYSCAQALCRLIAVEEMGLGLPPPDLSGRCSSADTINDSLLVAADDRIHFFDLLKNKEERVYEIRATRYRRREGWLERVVETFAI